jgi:hypothetical protein
MKRKQGGREKGRKEGRESGRREDGYNKFFILHISLLCSETQGQPLANCLFTLIYAFILLK